MCIQWHSQRGAQHKVLQDALMCCISCLSPLPSEPFLALKAIWRYLLCLVVGAQNNSHGEWEGGTPYMVHWSTLHNAAVCPPLETLLYVAMCYIPNGRATAQPHHMVQDKAYCFLPLPFLFLPLPPVGMNSGFIWNGVVKTPGYLLK